MRKVLLSLLAVMLAITATVTDAEAARRKKHHKKHEHHQIHKHKRKKRYVIAREPVIEVIHLAQTPQCGFLIFVSDCNSNSRNNIDVANKFNGMTTKSHRTELSRFMGVDPGRIAWCAAFVNSVLKANGFASTESLMAASYLNYGRITHDPQPGDVVVFSKLGSGQVTGHVSFYVDTIEQDGVKYVLSLGGNQDHGVNISAYPLKKVQGFRRPVAEQNI